MGVKYDGISIRPIANFSEDMFELLSECASETCSEIDPSIDSNLHFELVRNLISVEERFRTMVHRHGLFKSLDKTIRSCFYDHEDDALERGKILKDVRENKEERLKIRQMRLNSKESKSTIEAKNEAT